VQQKDDREGARRQDRALAVYSVLQSWIRNLDGIVLDRCHLERVLRLRRFKRARVLWIQEDLRDLFPHQKPYWYTRDKDSLASLFVSRLPLDEYLDQRSMSDEDRIALIAKNGGPRLGLFRMWPKPDREKLVKTIAPAIPFLAEAANFDERMLAAYLSLLSQGQISPESLQSFIAGE
jgi:hypothetical protein